MSVLCEPEQAISNPAQHPPVGWILTTAGTMLPQAEMKTSTPTRIVLTGFMGAGKSTVGRLLANHLGWRFFDVDDTIVEQAGAPIASIFAQQGEFAFRRMETNAIAHVLGEQRAVIALGGGAVEVLANRLLLEQTPQTSVVFLDAPLPALLARCHAQPNAAERPNLRLAEERFHYRAPLYRHVARVRLGTEHRTPQETTQELLHQLGLNSH